MNYEKLNIKTVEDGQLFWRKIEHVYENVSGIYAKHNNKKIVLNKLKILVYVVYNYWKYTSNKFKHYKSCINNQESWFSKSNI